MSLGIGSRWGVRGILLVAMLACGVGRGAETLQFQLHDSWGREVRSQDYKGRPIFLEFGACW